MASERIEGVVAGEKVVGQKVRRGIVGHHAPALGDVWTTRSVGRSCWPSVIVLGVIGSGVEGVGLKVPSGVVRRPFKRA